MKINKLSDAGALNPRILAAFLMCAAAAWLTAVSFATQSPATATLSTSNKSITYTGPCV
jgi:hypothetical protein